jgi:NarL family two-component system response regulator LiaR
MKLLLVDDHAGVRRTLRATLELNSSFEIVGDVGNGREALETMGRELPDVVIMDARMPVMDGAEATRAITKRWPEVCVLAFTSTAEVARVAPMLEAGARGCILKGQTPDRLIESIQSSIADHGSV